MSFDVLWLLLSWLAYFVIHSLLASLSVKNWVASNWPTKMPLYRLSFNFLAVLLLIPPMALTFAWQGEWLWQWQGVGQWVANGMVLVAVVGFIWSMKYYDGSEFLGFRQLKNRVESVEDQEHFQLSPLHRWVRHPWYFFALLLIWSHDMHLGWLISASMMTPLFYYRLTHGGEKIGGVSR
ncbi:MAG: hypothetical protein Q9O24_13610 [Gammaproteobacteria bacterium]|nr:hypothetical protein [Gammaproteobacteria bacterium]